MTGERARASPTAGQAPASGLISAVTGQRAPAGPLRTADSGPDFGFAGIPVQPKLEVGSVDDPLEREADRVADAVMQLSDSDSGAQLSRKCACEDDDEPKSLQAKAAGSLTQAAPAGVGAVVNAPGMPLDPATRGFFEPRFGRDFGDIRIHTDPAAAESACAINALGYTVGRDVVFADGQYSPHTSNGRRLLAHELAHVIQQSSATPAVIRRYVPEKRWHVGFISAEIAVLDAQGHFHCSGGVTGDGTAVAAGNFTGRPSSDMDVRKGNFASVCLSPCVGRPLNLEPQFSVDAMGWGTRPQPFDPPRLSVNIVYYPDVGDPDVLMRETGTGEYDSPGAPLKTGFGNLTFYTPESTGQLMVSLALADPSSGTVAVYSESIPVVNCPVVATDPEPIAEEPAKPDKPANGRPTRFNIEVQDPDGAPLVYELIGANTAIEGPGGFFPVWQDPAGEYYYLNNGHRVDLPNFARP